MTNERDQHQMSGRIPDFATREEEAAFWDAQDFTEVLDETRPVKLEAPRGQEPLRRADGAPGPERPGGA